METWMPVTGYEGLYEVSSFGRVRGLDRIVFSFSANAGRVVPLRRKAKVLSQNSAGSGYMTVCLSIEGRSNTCRVAALVCEAFNGPRPSGMFVCHNDGNKLNNRQENLRWDTPKNNQLDRIAHKTDCRGELVGTTKLTTEQVLAIKAGMKVREATQTLGISRTQYYRIFHGISWAHIMKTETPAMAA